MFDIVKWKIAPFPRNRPPALQWQNAQVMPFFNFWNLL